MYRFSDYSKPYAAQCCTSVHIKVVSNEKCLACQFDCDFECESGRLPVLIYCMANSNKCFMFFKEDENDIDYCVYYIASRVPLEF